MGGNAKWRNRVVWTKDANGKKVPLRDENGKIVKVGVRQYSKKENEILKKTQRNSKNTKLQERLAKIHEHDKKIKELNDSIENVISFFPEKMQKGYMFDSRKYLLMDYKRNLVKAYVEATKLKDRNAILALDKYYTENKDLKHLMETKEFSQIRKSILHLSPEDLDKINVADYFNTVHRYDNGIIDIETSHGERRLTIDTVNKTFREERNPSKRLGFNNPPKSLSPSQKELIKSIRSTTGLGMGDFPGSSIGPKEYSLFKQLQQLAESTGFGRIDYKDYQNDKAVYNLNEHLSEWLGVKLASGY